MEGLQFWVNLPKSQKKVDPEFSINAHDVRFLKSLRISVDDAA